LIVNKDMAKARTLTLDNCIMLSSCDCGLIQSHSSPATALALLPPPRCDQCHTQFPTGRCAKLRALLAARRSADMENNAIDLYVNVWRSTAVRLGDGRRPIGPKPYKAARGRGVLSRAKSRAFAGAGVTDHSRGSTGRCEMAGAGMPDRRRVGQRLDLPARGKGSRPMRSIARRLDAGRERLNDVGQAQAFLAMRPGPIAGAGLACGGPCGGDCASETLVRIARSSQPPRRGMAPSRRQSSSLRASSGSMIGTPSLIG
jgi:hypothetical protein